MLHSWKSRLPVLLGSSLLLISAAAMAADPAPATQPAAEKAMDPVVVQKLNLKTGENEYFRIKPEAIKGVIDEAALVGFSKDPKKMDEFIDKNGTKVSKEELASWDYKHEADKTLAVQGTLFNEKNKPTDVKDERAIIDAVLKASPNGEVAKALKWAMAHEADAKSGAQGYFHHGFGHGYSGGGHGGFRGGWGGGHGGNWGGGYRGGYAYGGGAGCYGYGGGYGCYGYTGYAGPTYYYPSYWYVNSGCYYSWNFPTYTYGYNGCGRPLDWYCR